LLVKVAIPQWRGGYVETKAVRTMTDSDADENAARRQAGGPRAESR
jgi:hypothetical protein